jgi:tetratricopeptide (TPR) repeat protein
VSREHSARLALAVWMMTLCAAGQNSARGTVEQQFQTAVTRYEAGSFSEAAEDLEKLVPRAPKNFDVHELLGLVYAAQSKNDKATEEFKIAVAIRPDSAAARTNLAAGLYRSGMLKEAEAQFRKALVLEPLNYDANRNLGALYLQSDRVADAVPLLERSQKIHPSYENGYDLALAYFQTDKPEAARHIVDTLAQQNDASELHALLAQVDEKEGKFLPAVNEFETAAHMNPTEENLFDWASELLLHRTYDPAIEIFQQAVERFPTAPRDRIGLGMALYGRGRYDDAVESLVKAIDLGPSDANAYLFLFKIYDNSSAHMDEAIERFRRFSTMQPHSAVALYYYAASQWKGGQANGNNSNPEQVQSLVQRSLELNPDLAEAHMLLGNLYDTQRQYDQSIPEYERAVKLNDNLPDAHYRLSMDYLRIGQKERANQEMEAYQKLRTRHMAEIDKEGEEIQQFVYAERNTPSARP